MELTTPGGCLRFFAAHRGCSLSGAVLTGDPPVLAKCPTAVPAGPSALGNVSHATEDPSATFFLLDLLSKSSKSCT